MYLFKIGAVHILTKRLVCESSLPCLASHCLVRNDTGGMMQNDLERGVGGVVAGVQEQRLLLPFSAVLSHPAQWRCFFLGSNLTQINTWVIETMQWMMSIIMITKMFMIIKIIMITNITNDQQDVTGCCL